MGDTAVVHEVLEQNIQHPMFGKEYSFIAWWPGHIKASSVNDTPFAFYDIMPTFCDLVGIKQFA